MTGATGYIGGRLVPRLIEAGRHVRVLVRNPRRASSRSWFGAVETVIGDATNPRALSRALEGIDTAYYLIHSMAGGMSFHDLDITAARAFGHAAKGAGVRRIIYLGALGESSSDLSPHLRSRHETGSALRESGIPVTEFRSAIVVGSGSASFEIIRNLVERLPVMVCPRWVYSKVQPLAIDDLLAYLVSALDTPASNGRIIEVGGRDATTFHGLMTGYAKSARTATLVDSYSGADTEALIVLGLLVYPDSRRIRLRVNRRDSQRRSRKQRTSQRTISTDPTARLRFSHWWSDG